MSQHEKDDHDLLLRKADITRARLMATLDELDRRRHDFFDVKLQIARHKGVLSIAGAVGLALLGGGVALVVRKILHHDEHRWHDRVSAAKRSWLHPERVASNKQGPFFAELGRKLLMGTLTFAGMQLARRAVRGLLPERGTSHAVRSTSLAPMAPVNLR